MHEFGWTPQQWLDLSYKERVLVIAGIRFHNEQEKAAQEQAEAEAEAKVRKQSRHR
ncbi:hypothetical protein [Weissella cibaria]|nr:hypothetical protein [Weissella cibaria]MBU7561120.1 hypothetical protein [Weissella cibaria]